jgi:hypothetical protein
MSSDLINPIATRVINSISHSFNHLKQDRHSFNHQKHDRQNKLKRARKALAKSLKANREFFQSNAISTGMISSLVLGGAVQVLLGVKDYATPSNSFLDDEFLEFGSYSTGLYATCVFEGLSLLFGFLMMLMPENQNSSFAKSVKHLWPFVFILMMAHSFGGIVIVLVLLTKSRNPSRYCLAVLAPAAIFGSMAIYLIFVKVQVSYKVVKQVDPNAAHLENVKIE